MKRIYLLGLFLTLLTTLGFQAKAGRAVTVNWDIPGSIIIFDGAQGEEYRVALSPTQTSYTTDENGGNGTIYIAAADGYTLVSGRITPADGDTDHSAQDLVFTTSTTPVYLYTPWMGSSWSGATVNVVVEKVKREDSFEIEVANGVNVLTAKFFSGTVLDLKKGKNEFEINPDTDNPLTINVAGRDVYQIYVNDEEEVPENQGGMYGGSYAITVKPNDYIYIKVYENDSDEKQNCKLNIEYLNNMEGSLTMVHDSSAGKMYLPSQFEGGVINEIEAIEGSLIKLNFRSDDYTISSVKLNGTALVLENESNGIDQYAQFTIEQPENTLVIDGKATEWNDITYNFYVTDAEGICFGSSLMDDQTDSDVNFTVVQENVSGLSWGSEPWPDTTKLISVTISQKNNGGRGTLYFMPKDGYFVKGMYKAMTGKDDDTMASSSSVSPEDGYTFYIDTEKMGDPYTAALNVVSDYTTVKLKGSGVIAGQWGNPDAMQMDLTKGESTLSFTPNYDIPFTIAQQSETVYVYLDGAPVTGVKDSTTEITNYTFEPYYPSEGESSDLHSEINVYINASASQLPTLSGASLNLEHGATAEFTYSPIKHMANAAGQTLIAGTLVTVKPTSENTLVVFKGEVKELDENGEFSFNAEGAAAGNVVTVTTPRYVSISKFNPSKTKKLKKITLTIPALTPEEGEELGTLECVEELLSGISLAGSEEVAKFGEFVEMVGDDDGNVLFTFELDNVITEDGTYTLTVPAGLFVEKKWDEAKDGFVAVPGGYETKKASLRIKVDSSLLLPVEDYTLSPADKETVGDIEVVTISFPQISSSEMFEGYEFPEATFTCGGKTISGAIMYVWGGEEEYRVMKVTPITDDEEPIIISEDGTWTLNIPEGAFVFDGESSPAITATYTIEPLAAPQLTYENGSTITDPSHLGTIYIYYPDATTAEVNQNMEEHVTLVGKGEAADYKGVGTLEVVPLANPMMRVTGVTVKATIEPAPTKVAEYTLNMKRGALTLDGGKTSPELTKVYTKDTVTGVLEVFADENGNVTVYSFDGKVLLENVPATELRGLKKGLYIINGKKTLVK